MEVVKGMPQFVDGVGDYSKVIQNDLFTPGTQMYFRIAAVNSVGTSLYSTPEQYPVTFYDGM